jgi:cytochrome c556
MRTNARLVWVLIAGAVAACSEPADEASAPPATEAPAPGVSAAALPQEPGWTGVSEPEEVIEARRVLMIEAERLIMPIDAFTIGTPVDADALRDNARAIEAMLLALPHLFPPTTNRYDPTVLESPTVALPAIWENFDAFLAQAGAAEMAAAALIEAGDDDAFRAAGMRLRAACDACHAAYMKPYTPPKALPEDFEFDFESVLPDE